MTISNRFILVGPRAGQNVSLRGHDFVDGVYDFFYEDKRGRKVLPSQEDIKLKHAYLERMYNAHPEGSPELEAAEARFENSEPAPGRDTPDEREAREQAARNEGKAPGQETEQETEQVNAQETEQVNAQPAEQVTERNRDSAIRTALLALDGSNDDHWTDGDLPAVKTVRELAKLEDVSRGDIKRVAPDMTRDVARKEQKAAD